MKYKVTGTRQRLYLADTYTVADESRELAMILTATLAVAARRFVGRLFDPNTCTVTKAGMHDQALTDYMPPASFEPYWYLVTRVWYNAINNGRRNGVVVNNDVFYDANQSSLDS
jgi:hypothetical protein